MEDPGVPSGGYCTEIAGSEIGADAGAAGASLAWTSELRVVPGVEAFDAQLEAAAASLADNKALEQREVPVIAAGTSQRVMSSIAERSHSGFDEC